MAEKSLEGRWTVKGCLIVAGPIVAGFALIALGFVYDIMFAGIPFQDPTPALQAQYASDAAIARMIELCGVCLVGLGLVIVLVRRLRGLGRASARAN